MSKNLEYNQDHRQQARDLVIEQFKRSQKFNDWLGVYIDQIQDIEDALWQLYTQRGVDTAEGVQLDILGKIVGQPRLGLSDTDYRTRIKVRIRLNKASGLADDIYAVFGLMLGNQIGAVTLQEAFPAGLIVQMDEYVATSPSVLAEILREARGAGIDTSLVYLPSANGIFECCAAASPEVSSTTQGFRMSGFGTPAQVTPTSSGAQNGLGVVSYGGSDYLVTMYGITAMTSATTAVRRTTPSGGPITSFAFDSTTGLLIAIISGYVYYTNDFGQNWSQPSTPRYVGGAGTILFNGTVWVAADANTGAATVYYSSNPTVLWSSAAMPGGTTTGGFGASVANGRFVMRAQTMSGAGLVTSTDGATWSSVFLGTFMADSPNLLAYINGLWVFAATTRYVFTSPDGTTWTQRDTGMTAGNFVGFVQSGARLVAIGTNGYAAYTDNGTSWTTVNAGFGSFPILSYTVQGSHGAAEGGTILVADGGGNLWRSYDGASWTSILTGGLSFSGVGYGAGYNQMYAGSSSDHLLYVVPVSELGGELAGVLQA